MIDRLALHYGISRNVLELYIHIFRVFNLDYRIPADYRIIGRNNGRSAWFRKENVSDASTSTHPTGRSSEKNMRGCRAELVMRYGTKTSDLVYKYLADSFNSLILKQSGIMTP